MKSRVLSVLEEEKFNTPNIHAAMLKNFLQNLPEPLLIPGYKKIFNIITGKSLTVRHSTDPPTARFFKIFDK